MVQKYQLGTFSIAGSQTIPGLVWGDKVVALSALTGLASHLGCPLTPASTLLELLEHWDQNRLALDAVANALEAGGDAVVSSVLDLAVPCTALRTHAPLRPRQILCSGANYRKHVVDLIIGGEKARDPNRPVEEVRAEAEKIMDQRAASGRPFVFTETPSAIIGPYDPIVLPADVKQPDWELELAAIIGRPARRVSRADALDYVAGYTIANDITARDLVRRSDVGSLGADWLAAKCAPCFLPIGPYLTPRQFVENPQDLRITLKLNGDVMQNESTADMIYSLAEIVEYLSNHIQLWPGDLILTGSPAGNGAHYNRFMRDGDIIEGEITGLGIQRNHCVAEKAPN
ncbi:MAG: fumarylacetoacetate hydrolase family protein [Caulobacteraceae bacterium]